VSRCPVRAARWRGVSPQWSRWSSPIWRAFIAFTSHCSTESFKIISIQKCPGLYLWTPTWLYLAATCRRQRSPSLEASFSLSLVLLTNHSTQFECPY